MLTVGFPESSRVMQDNPRGVAPGDHLLLSIGGHAERVVAGSGCASRGPDGDDASATSAERLDVPGRLWTARRVLHNRRVQVRFLSHLLLCPDFKCNSGRVSSAMGVH